MAHPKDVFKALPHVNEVWITEEGDHHLHDHNGGKRYTREEVEGSEDNEEIKDNEESENVSEENEVISEDEDDSQSSNDEITDEEKEVVKGGESEEEVKTTKQKPGRKRQQ